MPIFTLPIQVLWSWTWIWYRNKSRRSWTWLPMLTAVQKKESGSLDGDGSMIHGMIHHFLAKRIWMLWRRIHRYTLQEPADMLHGRIQRHLKQQGSQRIHQTQQGENFYISRMEACLVWLLIRRRIHLIKRYHRIQRNRSRRSYCWPSRNSFQMV